MTTLIAFTNDDGHTCIERVSNDLAHVLVDSGLGRIAAKAVDNDE